ncbi:hypothetical protein ACIGXA_26140 [Streptomyces fildesensis]|uniref:Uncharacterized protein n=1 Tax=Streptomyces fildesensis TaxID=375757 RepID=A0ABW8CC39_9ACTN
MTTWQPPGAMNPAKRRKRLTVFAAACAVPVLLAISGAAYLLLQYNNIAFLDGPGRSEVTNTAQDLLTRTTASIVPLPALGKSKATFSSCGRRDGLGQVQYTGGIVVPFSGVAATDHQKIEDQITTRGDDLTRNLEGHWIVSVGWDSPTSTTGRFHAYLSCTDIAN